MHEACQTQTSTGRDACNHTTMETCQTTYGRRARIVTPLNFPEYKSRSLGLPQRACVESPFLHPVLSPTPCRLLIQNAENS